LRRAAIDRGCAAGGRQLLGQRRKKRCGQTPCQRAPPPPVSR
jgi:hypothetical protein